MLPKILIVDDDPKTLDSCQRLLRKIALTDVAESSEEGLDVLRRKGPYEVVIADYKMPGIDGVEFLAKAAEISTDSVRILYTGYGDMECAVSAVNKGNVYRILTKPCPANMIVQAVEDSIRYYRNETSEREKAWNALHESEQRYRLLAENIQDVIWAMDLDLNFSYMSPSVERLLGISNHKASKISLEELLTEESAEKVRKAFSRAIADSGRNDNGASVINLDYVNKKGAVINTEVRFSVVRDIEGAAMGLVGVTRDITERQKAAKEKKQLEEHLRQAHKMQAIGTLAGGIAHDFNNILSPIIGYTEMIITELGPDNPQRDDLKEVLVAANRAKELVGQILAFSRQSEGAATPLMLHPIIEDVLKLSRASFPASITIKKLIDKACGMVLCDPAQIHQVAMAICTNAYQAMAEGGVLKVVLEKITLKAGDIRPGSGFGPGKYVRLVFQDTGCGMTLQAQARIFEPYYTTRGVGDGSGMGLAVAHAIVKKHRGDIQVESSPGKGSAFYVYLPVHEKNSSQKPHTPSDLPKGQQERVLLVDDESSIIRMSSQMLSRLGYSVTSFTESEKALEAFEKAPSEFDLVITDMTMPGMGGDVLSEKIRGIRQDIPIILCTGFADRAAGMEKGPAGITAFLLKPLHMEDMAITVGKALGKDVGEGSDTSASAGI